MARLSVCIKSLVALLVIAAVLAVPQQCQAQSLQSILDYQIDTRALQQKMSLKESLSTLCDIVSHQKRNGNAFELPILVDAEAFKADDPAVPSVYDALVEFPPFPSKMTVAAALRMILGAVPTRNATYVVLPGHILITTEFKGSAQGRLHEMVRGLFDNRTVSSVIEDLSNQAGATIIIDNRAADKTKAVISARFLNDIELGGALRVITEMAELKVIVLDGAIFVTTPGHAEALRKEYFERIKLLTPPKAGPAPKVGGGDGGAPGVGLGGLPSAPDTLPAPAIDPFWPYTPQMGGRQQTGPRPPAPPQ